jgi:hypothetical protein
MRYSTEWASVEIAESSSLTMNRPRGTVDDLEQPFWVRPDQAVQESPSADHVCGGLQRGHAGWARAVGAPARRPPRSGLRAGSRGGDGGGGVLAGLVGGESRATVSAPRHPSRARPL